MEKVRLFKKADIILIVVTLVIGFALIIPRLVSLNSNNKVYAYIYISGKEEQKIDLSNVKTSYHINLECEPNLILQVEKGRIRVESADCPDKLCVKCGWLSKNFDTAVCLPANVIVTVKVANSQDGDVLTY